MLPNIRTSLSIVQIALRRDHLTRRQLCVPSYFKQSVLVLVDAPSAFLLVLVFVIVLWVLHPVPKIHLGACGVVVIWLTEVLAFLNFLILLVTSLALILGILLDVRWAPLARDALERLFAIRIFRVKLL